MIRAGMSNIKRQTIRAKPSSRWRTGDAEPQFATAAAIAVADVGATVER